VYPLLPNSNDNPWAKYIAYRNKRLNSTQVKGVRESNSTEEPPPIAEYLLVPEMSALINIAGANETPYHLLSLLWRTGGKLQEVLDITVGDIILGDQQGLDKNTVTLLLGSDEKRSLILPYDHYTSELLRYKNRLVHDKKKRLFSPNRQTATRHINTAVNLFKLNSDNTVPTNLRITASTIRASFAVNAVLHGIPLTEIARWMGYRHLSSVAPYASVTEMAGPLLMSRVSFTQNTNDVEKLLLD